MRKAFFLFLLIFAIAQLGFSTPYSLTSLPWDDYEWKKANPYILYPGSTEIFDGNTMHQSLQSLNLSNPIYDGITDSAIKTNMLSARSSYQKTLEQKDRCNSYMTINLVSYGYFSLVSGNLLIDLFSAFNSKNSKDIIFVSGVKGSEYLSLIYQNTDCMAYSSNWKSIMTSATNSVLLSQSLNNQIDKNLNLSLQKLYFSGVCEEYYSGIERVACDEIERNIQSYNKLNKNLDIDLSAFNDDISKNKPVTSKFVPIMTSLWDKDGVIILGSDILNQSDSTLNSAISVLNFKKLELENESKKVDLAITDGEKQKLYLITEGLDFDGVIGSNTDTIAQKFSILKNKQKRAKDLQNNASIPISKKSYLKDSLNNIKIAKDIVSSNSEESILLLLDAQNVVENNKKITEKEFADLEESYQSKTPSVDIAKKFSAISKLLNQTKPEDPYGTQFTDYAEARSQIKVLKEQINGYDPVTQKQADLLFLDVEKLIKNAKSDGLDTISEDLKFNLIKDSRSKTLSLEVLGDIRSSILKKAANTYSDLQSQSDRLHFLVDGVADLYYYQSKLLDAENGLFKNGNLIVDGTSIGRLSGLKNTYDRLELDLSKYKSITLSAKLVPTIIFYTNGILLDESVPYSLAVNIDNPFGLDAENVKVSVTIPQGLMFTKSDIKQGSENIIDITLNKNQLELNLKNISKYSNYQVVFDKSAILARSLSTKKFVYGTGAGGAILDKNTTIMLDTDGSLILNSSSTYIVDGNEYLGEVLSAGSHVLTSQIKLFNAYNLSYENYQTSRLGLNQVVSYDEVIKSDVDLDKVPVFISDKNDQKISRVNVLAITSHKTLNKGILSNGIYKTEVYEIKKLTNATLKISYILENVSDYINEKIILLKGVTNNSQILSLVNAAQSDLQNNDTSNAVINIQKAQNELDRLNSILVQKQSEYDSLREAVDAQYIRVSAALSNLDQKSEFYSSFLKRKNELSKTLSNSDELKQNQIEKAISTLKEVDNSWEKTTTNLASKKIFLDYNSIKSKILAHGFESDLIEEFNSFEIALGDFGSSNNLDSFVTLANSFAQVSKVGSNYESNYTNGLIEGSTTINILKNQLKNDLNLYILEYKNAKGSSYEKLFPVDPSSFDKIIKDAELIISKKGSLKELSSKNSELQLSALKIKSSLTDLKKISEDQVSSLKTLFAAKKDSVDSSQAVKIQKNIDRASAFIDTKQYVDALKLSQNTLLDLTKTNPKDQTQLIILSALTVIVLGAIAFYIIKQKKGEDKGNSKVFRKLEKVEEVADNNSPSTSQSSDEKYL
ncbi:MAG: hypothetical protein AABX38_00145 [Candidatus Micrarchaeota archaeon]